MSRLLLGPYSLLWHAARPFLRRHKRLKDGFPLRLAPGAWAGFPWGDRGADLWIQAASGGESFLARQLLGEMHALCATKQQHTLRILCTSCTRQGLDVLEAAREYALAAWSGLDIAVRVFPLDEPAIMRRALAYANPGAVALLETELWPGLMAAAVAKRVPVLVLNGRMTEKSFLGYRFLGPFWRSVAPARILAMADEDASRFADLFGYGRVGVMQNMKFDGVPEQIPAPGAASPALALLPEPAPVILLASVREEEEPLLMPVIANIREKAPHAVVVVAPRHMERVAAWRKLLGNAFGQAHCAARSELEAGGGGAKPGQVVLWDRFGELTALYGRANAVFVGGSLAPLGGQNFLEAAGQGRGSRDRTALEKFRLGRGSVFYRRARGSRRRARRARPRPVPRLGRQPAPRAGEGTGQRVCRLPSRRFPHCGRRGMGTASQRARQRVRDLFRHSPSLMREAGAGDIFPKTWASLGGSAERRLFSG